MADTAHHNLTVVKGDAIERTLGLDDDGVPLDLSGYTGRLYVQDRHGVGQDFLVTILSEGRFSFAATPTLPAGNYHYWLRLVEPEGTPWTVMDGDFIIYPGPEL